MYYNNVWWATKLIINIYARSSHGHVGEYIKYFIAIIIVYIIII